VKGKQMACLLEGIAEAIREESRSGRKHTELAKEWKISSRTIGAIVWEERRIGPKTLEAIVAANPPWLMGVVLASLGRPEEGNGKRRGVVAGPAGERRLKGVVVDLGDRAGERTRARRVVGIVVR
jgi:hypothetical protein